MKTQAFLFCLLAGLMLAETTIAENDVNFGKRKPTVDEVINALSKPDSSSTDNQAVDSLDNQDASTESNQAPVDPNAAAKSRSIGSLIQVTPPQKPTYHRVKRPSSVKTTRKKTTVATSDIGLSIEITFDYNSAELTEDAKEKLRPIGEALNSDKLKNLEFVVEGHTDAVGSDAYNNELSKERADAVKSFLVGNFSIQPARIQTLGKGKQALFDPANPDSEVNRRVRIVARR